MKTVLAVLVLLAMGAPAWAQDQKIPLEVMEKLADDLAKFAPDEEWVSSAQGGMGYNYSGFSGGNKPNFEVTAKSATIYEHPNTEAQGVAIVGKGWRLNVLGTQDDWFMVTVPYTKNAVMGYVSKKLGVATIQPASFQASARNWWQSKVAELLRNAAEMKNAYSNNPYVRIPGFSVSLGITPSLNINFDFVQ